MQRSHFVLKYGADLKAEDFDQFSLWAPYCATDDVEEMVYWGYPEATVRAGLDEIRWSDDYYFPLPLEAANSEWMRDKLFGAVATTADGIDLPAYVGEDHRYVAVFIDEEEIFLAPGSYSDPEGKKRRLASLLGTNALFPIRVLNRVTGERWTFAM